MQLSVQSVQRRASTYFPGLLVAIIATLGGCSDAAELQTRRSTSHRAPVPVGEPDGGVDTQPVATTAPLPSLTPPPQPTIDEVGDVFQDPGCPTVMQRFEDSECDPMGGAEQCEEGMGCFPYVDYPAEPCAPETFGARCMAAGAGVQGDPCSGQRCAHGFLCVVTSRGTQCAELCEVPGHNSCADGFICGSLDIDGYGVCI